ncbi:MAG TPA: ABC transporter ATP-binding protein, partial [Gammaproteobacteria bacterium]
PELLLCDEPTGALDSKTGILVLEAINQVNRELGTTTAVITHNTVIGSMADRVLHIADGRVANIEENTKRVSAKELAW